MPARINIYDQRTNPQGRDQPFARAPNVVGTGIGAALSRAGDAAGQVAQAAQVADNAELQIQRLQQNREEDDARVYASQKLAEAGAAAIKSRETALTEAPDGWRGVTSRVEADLKAFQDDAINAAPTETARRFLTERFAAWTPEVMAQTWDSELSARRKWRVDTIKSAIDQTGNVLAADPNSYAQRAAEQNALIDTLTDVTGDEKRTLRDYADGQFAIATVAGLVEKDPHAALAQLKDPEAGGAFAKLTGPQRISLTNSAQAEIDRREAKWKSQVREQVTGQIQAMQLGLPVANPLDDSVIRSALGDDAADSFAMVKATSEQFSGMATRPTSDLVALANTPPPKLEGAEGVKAMRLWQARQGAVKQALAARAADPMAFYLKQGIAPQSDIVTPLQGGDWAGFASALKSRAAAAQQNAGQYGIGPEAYNPLTKGEAQVLSETLRQATPQQKAQILKTVSGALGASVTNPVFGGLMRQIAPGSANTAYAGYLTAIPRKVGDVSGEQAAQLLLEGEALLSPTKADKVDGAGKMALPSENDLRFKWANYIGKAYANIPGAEQGAYEAYRAVYAALSARAGDFSNKIVNDARARQAAALATGGVAGGRNTGMSAINGRDTLLPWGMDKQEFLDTLNKGWPSVTGKYGLGATKPDQYQFAPVGGDTYQLMSGDRPVVSADGKPARVQFRLQHK